MGNQSESDRHTRGQRFYKKEGGASTARILALRFIFARTKDEEARSAGACSPFLVFMAKVGARSRRPTHRFDDSVFQAKTMTCCRQGEEWNGERSPPKSEPHQAMNMNKGGVMGTRSKSYLGVAGVLILMLGGGCTKSIQTDSSLDHANAGAKSLEQRHSRPGETETTSEKASLEASAGSGRQFGAGGSQLSDEHQLSMSEGTVSNQANHGSGSAFPSLSGVAQRDSVVNGQQELTVDDLVVAKAKPSDVARRQAEESQRFQVTVAGHTFKDVFFPFDSWTITEEGKESLSVDGEWLKANTSHVATIEGHCDERGTSAYNLVLGEKRAKAVRKYLIDLGVNANRLTNMSYGKERPFCTEQGESCYDQNRRSHLNVHMK
jgi:peptidoglycan-associated lipoprotein